MHWWYVPIAVVILVMVRDIWSSHLRRRARRQWRINLTTEQMQLLAAQESTTRAEALYQIWKPKIATARGPQEFYDVEKSGL